MRNLIILQVIAILCFYLSAWVGRKKLLYHAVPQNALYVNNRIYPFYVIGVFAYLTSFLLLLHFFPQISQRPQLFFLPAGLAFWLSVFFSGSFFLFFLLPVICLGLRAHATQKKQIFNPFQPLELVVAGPYKYCRHPMALGIYSLFLGYCVIYPSLYSLISTFVGFIPAHLYFILHYEEAELAIRFGAQYSLYKSQTPFMFPHFWSSCKGIFLRGIRP